MRLLQRLRQWWSRPSAVARVHALSEEIKSTWREIEADKREIAETKPIVEEAVRRTNQSFIDVERATRRASLEVALLRDLNEGWNGHG